MYVVDAGQTTAACTKMDVTKSNQTLMWSQKVELEKERHSAGLMEAICACTGQDREHGQSVGIRELIGIDRMSRINRRKHICLRHTLFGGTHSASGEKGEEEEGIHHSARNSPE